MFNATLHLPVTLNTMLFNWMILTNDL